MGKFKIIFEKTLYKLGLYAYNKDKEVKRLGKARNERTACISTACNPQPKACKTGQGKTKQKKFTKRSLDYENNQCPRKVAQC